MAQKRFVPRAYDRSTIRTPSVRAKLLDSLTESPNVRRACRVAKVSKSAFYAWYREDAEFQRDVKDAIDEPIADLIDAGWKRAMAGEDTRLMMFYLQAHAPELYAPKSDDHADRPTAGVVLVPVSGGGGRMSVQFEPDGDATAPE